jgi:hypothetical protein
MIEIVLPKDKIYESTEEKENKNVVFWQGKLNESNQRFQIIYRRS